MSRVYQYLPQHLQQIARQSGWSDDEAASAIHQSRLSYYGDDLRGSPSLEDTRESIGLDRRGFLGKAIDSSASGFSDLIFDAPFRTIGGAITAVGDITGIDAVEDYGKGLALRNQMDPNPSDGFAELLGRAPVEIARFGLALAPFIGPASRAAAMTATGARSFIAGSSARKAAYVMGTAMLSSEYGRYRSAEEIDPAKAAVGAGLMTAAEFFSDRLTLGALSTGKFLSNSSFQKFLGERLGMIGNKIGGRTSAILATSATAAITEAITEFLQGGIDEGIINPESTIGSVLDAAANPEAITKAFVLGGLVGGGLGSINQGVSAYLDAVYPQIDGAPTNSDRDTTDPRETKYDQTRRTRETEPESDTEASVAEAHAKAEKESRSDAVNDAKAEFAARTGVFDPDIPIKFDPGPDKSLFGERTGDNVLKPKKPEDGYFSADWLRKTLSEIVGTDIVNSFNEDYTLASRYERVDDAKGKYKHTDIVHSDNVVYPHTNRLHVPANQPHNETNIEFLNRVINTPEVNREELLVYELLIGGVHPEMINHFKSDDTLKEDGKPMRIIDVHRKIRSIREDIVSREGVVGFDKNLSSVINFYNSSLRKYGKGTTPEGQTEARKNINFLNRRHVELKRFLTDVLPDILPDISKPGTYVNQKEAPAIFVDLAIRRPDIAKKISPEGYKAFQSYMKKDPVLGPLFEQHQKYSFEFEQQPEWYKAKLAAGNPATILQKNLLSKLKEYKSFMDKSTSGDMNPITFDAKTLSEQAARFFGRSISRRNLWAEISKKWGIFKGEERQSLLGSSEALATIMFKYGTTRLDGVNGWLPNRSVHLVYKDKDGNEVREIDSIDRIESEMFDAAQRMAVAEGGNAHEIFHDTWARMVMENAKHALNTERGQTLMSKNDVSNNAIAGMKMPEAVLPKEYRDNFAQRIHNQIERLTTQLTRYGRFSPGEKNRLLKAGYKFLAPLRTKEQTQNDLSLYGVLGLPNLENKHHTDTHYDIPDAYNGVRELMSRLVYMSNQQLLTHDIVHKLALLGPAHATIVNVVEGAPQNRPKSTEDSYVISYWGHLGEINPNTGLFENIPDAQTIHLGKSRKRHYWVTVHNKDFIQALKALPRPYFGGAYRKLHFGRRLMTGMITNATKFIGTAFLRSFPEAHATTNVRDYNFVRSAEMMGDLTKTLWGQSMEQWDPETREEDFVEPIEGESNFDRKERLRESRKGMPDFSKKPPTFRELLYTGAMYSGISGVNVVNDVSPGSFGASGIGSFPGRYFNPKKPLTALSGAYESFLQKFTIPSQIAEMMPRLSAAIQKLEQGGTWIEAGNSATITAVDYKDQPTVKFLRYITNLFIFMGAQINSLNRWNNVLFRTYKLGSAEAHGQWTKEQMETYQKDVADHLDTKHRAYTVASLMALGTIAIYAWNNEDEEKQKRYRDLSAWDKARYWNIFIGDEHLKLPLPHELAFLSVMPTTAALDTLFKNPDRELLTAFAQSFEMTFGPAVIPSILDPIYRVVSNKRFGGTKVIPDYMMDRPAEGQYFSHTSILYKSIGQSFGWSPLKTEAIMGGYLGYFSDILEAAAEGASWDNERYGEKPFSDFTFEITGISGFIRNERQSINRWTREYSLMLDRAQAAEANIRLMMADYQTAGIIPSDEEFTEQKKLADLMNFFSSTIKLAADTNKMALVISHTKSLSVEEKERRIINLYKKLNSKKESDYKRALKQLEDLEDVIYQWDNRNFKLK